MKTELHLCIIWDRARPQQTALLDDLRARFTVRTVYEITWPVTGFPRNLTRFYGKALPAGSDKHVHCGDGPFLLVIFEVETPVYAERDTLAGRQTVLTQVFDFKQHYRDQQRGGLPIHATNNPDEVAHDLFLLLGKTTAAVQAEGGSEEWSGEILPLARDLTGTNGWPDLKTLFTALEIGGRYVVLRNFEALRDSGPLDPGHNDIDILCDDPSLALFANGEKRFDLPESAHYSIRVGDTDLFFDFRHVGDGYYCDRFAAAILRDRVADDGGFHRPSDSHHYYALLYHAILHKPRFGSDYCDRLNRLAPGIGNDRLLSGSRLQALAVLDDYMAAHGYGYSTPKDTTVPLEHGLLAAYREALRLDAGNGSPSATGPGLPNALQPFAHHLTGRVLEVGARRGELTARLASRAESVSAIEPSARLRSDAQQQLAGCAHVELLAGLPAPSTGRHYDAIVLDGQLPFAARFIDGAAKTAVDDLLRRLRALLTPDGVLIVLENNALGMTTLSADADTAADSLQGRIDETRCFGAHELRTTLESAGFQQQRWHYAFPDLGRSTTIVGAAALQREDFDVAALIGSTFANVAGSGRTAFPVQAAWNAAVRNHQVGTFANAFIVLAAPVQGASLATTDLAHHYATARLPYHAKSVTFTDTGDGILVRHRKLHPDIPAPENNWLEARTFDEAYLAGRPWQLELERLFSRPGWRFGQLESWVREWFERLVALELHDLPRPLQADTPVPARLLDAMPRNLIIAADGSSRFVDLEWVPGTPIPLGYVMFRGILLAIMSVREVAQPVPDTPVNAQGIFLYIAQRLGITITQTAIADYVAREQAFQLAASGWGWPELALVGNFSLQLRTDCAAVTRDDIRAAEPEPVDTALEADRDAYIEATTLFSDGRSDEGLQRLVEQAEQGSRWWEVFNDLGVHLFNNGGIADAEALFQRALELEPHAADALINLARIRTLENRREDALACLGEVIRHHPRRTEVVADIRALLSSFDDIPVVAWARLVSDLRGGNPQR